VPFGTVVAHKKGAAGCVGRKIPDLPGHFERKIAIMQGTIIRLKKIAIALVALPLLAFALLNGASVPTTSAAVQDDVAAIYKAKCAMCHGAKAEKKFDPAKSDEELLNIVLKGGKPGMPAFETKGINEAQAKGIVAHMKGLRAAPPASE
jgi:mono/diheme cytochrome c family protein